MKITLIRPSALVNSKAFAMNPSPPLGLAFIAGALHEAGHEVTAIDAIGESPMQFNPIEFQPNITENFPVEVLATNGLSTKEIIERIPEDSQLIGVSCMFSNNWLADRHLISVIGKTFPDAVIISGGESMTAMPSFWMQQAPELDICVLGEGDETIVDLVSALENKIALSKVNGINYRNKETNEIIPTGKRMRVKDVSKLALPAWQFFPLNNYFKYKVQWGITNRKSLPVMATRGCPYSCTFCSNPQMWGTGYYMRSPQHVADEIEHLMSTYGIGNFDFYDLTAIIRREWIIEFAQEVVKRKLDITWQIPAGTRSEAIDDEVARHLCQSGCTDITYAPESGSVRILKLIKKKVKLPDMLRSMRHANKEGMHVYINTIFALPDETHRDAWKTLWFFVRASWVGVCEVGTAMFHPYPGSALFERMRSEGKIDLTTDNFFVNTITISPLEKCRYHYNENVSAAWYSFYLKFGLILFYTTNYLFRPARFFKMLRNVALKQYETRTERALGKMITKKFSGSEPALSHAEQAHLT